MSNLFFFVFFVFFFFNDTATTEIYTLSLHDALPITLFAGALAREGPFSLWALWIPACALTGAWMGLREEGGGPSGGERGWMMLPVLLLAAVLPWLLRYPQLVERFDHFFRSRDILLIQFFRQLGDQGERLASIE